MFRPLHTVLALALSGLALSDGTQGAFAASGLPVEVPTVAPPTPRSSAPSAMPTIQPLPANWPSPCADTNRGYVDGQLIVAFQATATTAQQAAFKRKFRILAERPMSLPGTWVMRVACATDIPKLCAAMKGQPGLRYAEPDAVIQLDDPLP